MGAWVVTVAGIAILSVLCDVILHEGQTQKYVKTVFGVVITLVIVQPLVGLFVGGKLDLTFQTDEPSLQQQYLDSVTSRQNAIAVDKIVQTLNENGIEVESVTVSTQDKTVTAILCEDCNVELEVIVKKTVAVYFADYRLITIWK